MPRIRLKDRMEECICIKVLQDRWNVRRYVLTGFCKVFCIRHTPVKICADIFQSGYYRYAAVETFNQQAPVMYN